jgi:glycosyltransferase involved in cell wall biosynthesis
MLANAQLAQIARQTEPRSYVLMTAAYNEEAHIETTIQSVLQQTRLPIVWAIVSDGSTDGTDEIVRRYAEQYDFIRFIRVERSPGHSFRSKVAALRKASPLTADVSFDYIGNLDADTSVGPSYFEELITQFVENPKLGLAGGYVCEWNGTNFGARRGNRIHSVAHAAQLVRKECYQEIGGYAVLEYGGEDWHAQISAEMHGWDTRAFPEMPIFHHRHTGEGDNLLRHKFRQGRMDYSFGSDPLFETFKCLQRVPEKPILIGGIARWLGFWWSCVLRERRPVSDEFVSFLRSQQRKRLASVNRQTSGPRR